MFGARFETASLINRCLQVRLRIQPVAPVLKINYSVSEPVSGEVECLAQDLTMLAKFTIVIPEEPDLSPRLCCQPIADRIKYNRINIAIIESCSVFNRHRWVINLVVSVSLLALTGFSLFPLFGLVFDSGKAVATEPNGLSAAQSSQIQAQAQGYNQVLQREPENQVALKGLLDARLQLGDIKGSLLPLEKIAALNPQIADYTVLLAQTKQYLGDIEGATTSYRTVLTTQPQNINALQGLVSLLLDAKRPEAASGAIQDSIAKAVPGTDIIPLKLLLAQVYVTKQQNSDALAIYDGLMEANKQDFRPVLAKALVFKQMGNLTQSQTLLNAATELAPSEYKDQIKQLALATQPPKTAIAPSATNSTPAVVPSIAPSKSPAAPQAVK